MKHFACTVFAASARHQAAASFCASAACSCACSAETLTSSTDAISMVSVFLYVLCLAAGLILACSVIAHIAILLAILPGLLILACLICLLILPFPLRSKE